MNDEQKHRQEIEQLVNERFAAMFPPGSDGPDMGFNIGDLYEWAEVELAERNAPEPDVEMPDMPETCPVCSDSMDRFGIYPTVCRFCGGRG